MVTANNAKVQSFTLKIGAVNLASQLEREKTPLMREAILGCFSAFIRSDNFPAKRQYILELSGLEQLSRWICLKGADEEKKYGKPPMARKIRLKLRQVLYDFLNNDDSIVNEGFHVRDKLGKDEKLVKTLIDSISEANIDST